MRSDLYSRNVLAFLAALIPILGSLYAAGSYSIEHAGRRRERRIREHVKDVAWAREPEATARADARDAREPSAWHSPYDEIEEFEEKLLQAHGLSKTGVSPREIDLALAMSGPVATAIELRRQWVAILTAAVGVVLVAVDAMSTSS